MTTDALSRGRRHRRSTEDRLLLGGGQARERGDETLDLQLGHDDVFGTFGTSGIHGTQDLTAGAPIPVDDEVPCHDAAPAEEVAGIDELDAAAPGALGDVLGQIGGGMGVDAPTADRRLQDGLDLPPRVLEVRCNAGAAGA